MAKGIRGRDPSRADHRLIAYMLRSFFGKKKVLPVPEEFDRVAKVFARAGGSWERLFKGSACDLNLLRRVIKVAIKKSMMSKEPRFR